jgi:hypothetical protein
MGIAAGLKLHEWSYLKLSPTRGHESPGDIASKMILAAKPSRLFGELLVFLCVYKGNDL